MEYFQTQNDHCELCIVVFISVLFILLFIEVILPLVLPMMWKPLHTNFEFDSY